MKIFYFLGIAFLSFCVRQDSSTNQYKKVQTDSMGTQTQLSGEHQFFCNLAALGMRLDSKTTHSDELDAHILSTCGKQTSIFDGMSHLSRGHICDIERLKECVLADRDYQVISKSIVQQFKIDQCKNLSGPEPCLICPQHRRSEDFGANPEFCRQAYNSSCESVISDKLYLEICYAEKAGNNQMTYGYHGPSEYKAKSLRDFSTNNVESGIRQPSDCLFSQKTEVKPGSSEAVSYPVCLVYDDFFTSTRKELASVQTGVLKIQQGVDRVVDVARQIRPLAKKAQEIVFGRTKGPLEGRRPGLFTGFTEIHRNCRQLTAPYLVFVSKEDLVTYVTSAEKREEINKKRIEVPLHSFLRIFESHTQPAPYHVFQVIELPKDYKGNLAVKTNYYGLQAFLISDLFSAEVCEK
jgi:hypothetical protein